MSRTGPTPASAASSPWAIPGRRAELRADEVHVWLVSLDATDAARDALRQTLAPDEAERAQRFKFGALRSDFTVARGALRDVLSHYLPQRPDELRFSYQAHGKPMLPDHPEFQFNLSHAHRLALVAVTRDARVGVDLEWMDRKTETDEIAKRFFAPAEAEAMKSFAGETRRRAFFAVWTRKESFVKAIGDGISLGLDQFEVSASPDEPPRLLSIRGSAANAAQWCVHSLELPAGYVGAVTVESPSRQLKCWQWELDARG